MSPFRMMVLGGGSSQMSLLRTLKKQGFSIVLADMDPRAPGRAFCDIFEEASTFDIPAVCTAAKRQGIDGIITLGTDQPVLTAAVVAREMGLPFFLSPETALAVTNKRVMKQLFQKHHIPNVPFKLIETGFDPNELQDLQSPLVLKPVDSQGQRGIFKLEGPSEIRQYLPKTLSFSREKTALVEEYYPAKEITLSGWVTNGEIHILTITDRVTFESSLHIGICAAHRFPTMWEQNCGYQIHAITNNIVRAFQIKEGPIYFQMLIGKKGVLVNEIACRIGGAYEDEFIPLAAGVDILQLLIDGAAGKTTTPKAFHPLKETNRRPKLTIVLFFARQGGIHHFAPAEPVLEMGGVENLQYLLPDGTIVGEMENSTQRAGYLIIQGKSKAEVNGRVEEALKKIGIFDEMGNNLLIDTLTYCKHPL